MNYFKAFKEAISFIWTKKAHWYISKQDIPWDIFLPFVEEFNAQLKNLLDDIYSILDDTMSWFYPKITATGGLYNIADDPCKSVELGMMLRNSAECISDLLIHKDPVQGTLDQSNKKYDRMARPRLSVVCSSPVKWRCGYFYHVQEVRSVRERIIKRGKINGFYLIQTRVS